MIGRVVEVSGEGRHLHCWRGFMQVSERKSVIGRIPLDDISGLIVSAYGATYSNELLVRLSNRGVPVVLCGVQHRPEAVLWPCESNHRQSARLDAQIAAGRPLRKRLWRQLVRAKIGAQASTLECFGKPHAPLLALVRRVHSGDPGNIEGVAARRYWPLLFGKGFRRERGGGGANAMLNYGYTILRTTVARHLVATGLQPGIGIAHSNDGNAMRLVDDLVEPFRPMVDARVRFLVEKGVEELDRMAKRVLVELSTAVVRDEVGEGPLSNSIERLCNSLVQVFLGQRKELSLPVIDAATVVGSLEAMDGRWRYEQE